MGNIPIQLCKLNSEINTKKIAYYFFFRIRQIYYLDICILNSDTYNFKIFLSLYDVDIFSLGIIRELL